MITKLPPRALGGQRGGLALQFRGADRGLQSRQDKLASRRPIEDVDVKRVALDRHSSEERQQAERAGRGAEDRIAVAIDPLADGLQPLGFLGPNRAVGQRADIQDEVASLAGDVDQFLHQFVRRFEHGFAAIVTPPRHGRERAVAGGHRHRGLPERGPSLFVGESGGGNELLGRFVVAAGEGAVVDEDVGLQAAGFREDRPELGLIFRAFVFPAAVEPQFIDAAVIGEDFADLTPHVFQVAVEVRARRGAVLFPGAPRQIVGMVPVHDRIVKAQTQPLAMTLVGDLPDRIAAEGRALDAVVGELRVKQAEAVVMLGGDHQVFLSGLFDQCHPTAGVEMLRIELPHEFVVFLQRNLARVAHPLAAADERVEAPMNDRSEAVVAKPGGTLLQRRNVRGGRRHCRRCNHTCQEPFHRIHRRVLRCGKKGPARRQRPLL